MPHQVLKFPASVYPGEADAECPEAKPLLDVLIRAMQQQGPSPLGYNAKNLGRSKDHLWQINLKIERRQVRVLYAPYKEEIVLFRIHKKSSEAEQQRAYELAVKRKREYEARRRAEDETEKRAQRHVGNRTVH